LDLSLHGCYEWAVKPFFPLSLLEEIASRPRNAEPITLQHYFSGESFEASLTAVDDSLIHGVIEAKDDIECIVGNPRISWKSTCPIFYAREVEVLSGNPIYTLVDEPTRVRVQERQLFFKAFQDLNDSMGAKEVLILEKIFKTRFDLKEVRTLHLYGIVEVRSGTSSVSCCTIFRLTAPCTARSSVQNLWAAVSKINGRDRLQPQ
jgi:hypothetical protein